MYVWVIYDISSNRKRRKVSKSCQEYGLIRVQKSVFLGNLDSNSIDEIAEFSKDKINHETDAVFIIPNSDENFSKKIIIGKKFDEPMITGEKKDYFF